MKEKLRPLTGTAGSGPQGLPDMFVDDDGGEATVTVSHGPYAEQLPVANSTVEDIRIRYRDRFDIDPQSQAVLDGDMVDDQAIVRAGQMLAFIRRAGEKGARGAHQCGAVDTITIEGDRVEAHSPEGERASLRLAELLDLVSPAGMDTRDLVLPDGVKSLKSRGPLTVLVHQTPPRVHNFKWIEKNSLVDFGPGTEYRSVRLALPYLIVFAVFARGGRSPMELSHANECFFRTEPIRCLDDDLYYPALLNCSRFDPPDGHPLSWICTQYLRPSLASHSGDENRCVRHQLNALMHCLLETGFNYSSERHEGSSWFTQSHICDPRISSVERWQEESEKDPLFVLDVPWIPVTMTVRQVMDRIFARQTRVSNRPENSSGLANRIYQHLALKARRTRRRHAHT